MKEKIWLITGSTVVFLVLGLVLWSAQMRDTIAASILTQEKSQRMERELSYDETLEFELLHNEEPIPYDVTTKTYYLPRTADKHWIREDAFTLSDETLELYWHEDAKWKNILQAVEEGHAFSFMVSDGKRMQEGKIVFTGLPMIVLETQHEVEEETDYCKVAVIDPFRTDIHCYGYVSLRGRTSRVFPKKGLNLELVEENGASYKTSLLGLREDDDWKLNALYTDATKVRDKLCAELWNELARQTESPYDTGTRMEYFELMVDGEHLGLYTAMEQLDYKQFSLNKSEDVIYKGYAWAHEVNTDESTLDSAEAFRGHTIKTGNQKISRELWRPFAEYVDAANFHDETEDYDSEQFYTYLQEHMDMDNFLNIELYIQALYAFDNKFKNCYIAADLKDGGDYTLWRIPWDLNYSFGDRFDLEGQAQTTYRLEWAGEIMPEFMMSETLLEDGNQEFAKILNERWKELTTGTLSVDNVRKIAQENMDLLLASGAFLRDAEKWPESPHESSVDRILEFHDSRLAFLNEHYASYLE